MGVCVVCTLGRVCGVLVVRLGACPRFCGRGLAALFGVVAVCRAPPLVSAVWFPAPLGWGLLVVCPLAVPFACPPPSVSFPCRLGRCFSGVVPGPSRLWWVGGGSLSPARVPSPGVSRGGAVACTPRQGVTLLYGPSICTRSVQMDLLRSQVLQPFPTPGSGTLWVAGESLRDRRVSCLPRWTVCPTRSPSLGPGRSTCRGDCSWSGPLVTPPGPVPPRAADQRSRAYPTLLRVLRWGRYGHRGGPQTPEVGFPACVPRGPFSSRPPFRCAVCGGWCPVSPGWGDGGGGGGGFRRSWLCCLRACRPLLWSWFAVGVCVCCAVRARVVSVLVCGAWFVVCGVRWWCVGGVVAGVWCGWSLATPGGGSCVLLPATPGWVSLPVVVCGSAPLLAGVPPPAVACGVWCVVCSVW